MPKVTFIAAKGHAFWEEKKQIAQFTQIGDYGKSGKLYSLSVDADSSEGKATLKKLYNHPFYKGEIAVGSGKRMLEDLPRRAEAFYKIAAEVIDTKDQPSRIVAGPQTSVTSPQSNPVS